MDEILRSQNSAAVSAINSIASEGLNAQSPRTTHFSLSLADPVDTVNFSDEARSQLQNLQRDLGTQQGYQAQLQNAQSLSEESVVSDLDVSQLASSVTTGPSFLGESRVFGSSEDFVAQASLDLDQKASEFISWNNGTYQLGRNLQSPYGIYNDGGFEMSAAFAGNLAQPQAARAYAAMSLQSQNYSALAPNNTGISLRI